METIFFSRINQIKAKQQALRSDGLNNSKKLAGILQKPRELTKWVLPEIAKKRTEQQLPSKPAKETLSSEEEQILKQVNKY